jgi:hypothetical protein
MIQNILRHLGGVEQYGVVSLCLFGTLFAAVLLWALLQRKGHLEHMARVPFEDDVETPQPPHTHE